MVFERVVILVRRNNVCWEPRGEAIETEAVKEEEERGEEEGEKVMPPPHQLLALTLLHH